LSHRHICTTNNKAFDIASVHDLHSATAQVTLETAIGSRNKG